MCLDLYSSSNSSTGVQPFDTAMSLYARFVLKNHEIEFSKTLTPLSCNVLQKVNICVELNS